MSPSEDEHFSSDMHKGLMQLCESFLFLFFMWLQYFKRGEGPYNSKYVVALRQGLGYSGNMVASFIFFPGFSLWCEGQNVKTGGLVANYDINVGE